MKLAHGGSINYISEGSVKVYKVWSSIMQSQLASLLVHVYS